MMFTQPQSKKNLRCQKSDICQLRLLTLVSGTANFLFKILKLLNIYVHFNRFKKSWHVTCLDINDNKFYASLKIERRLMGRVFSWL